MNKQSKLLLPLTLAATFGFAVFAQTASAGYMDKVMAEEREDDLMETTHQERSDSTKEDDTSLDGARRDQSMKQSSAKNRTVGEEQRMTRVETRTESRVAAGMSPVEMLRKQSGRAFDQAFLSEMIQHHQESIDMAQLAKKRARDKQVKTLADQMISSHRSHLDLLRRMQAGEKVDLTGRVSTTTDVMMEDE